MRKRSRSPTLFRADGQSCIRHGLYDGGVHGFEVIADPVRRRILELLADGSRTAGDVVDVVRAEFAISQPAVSQHLKVLRDNRFVTVVPVGNRRLYELDPSPIADLENWLARVRPRPAPAFDALATEIARGRRERRRRESRGPATEENRRTS